ncbi:MAG TPA: TonB family protein [Bacteroidia bacterium]|jgi:protein TonB|nr:TonB family protein [Bacteroidia bacterium]
MTGHKTSGSWTDVTSIGRNDIVFEGRNKEYGAYYVRQRYNKALLLALLTATSVGVLSASIPFIISHFSKPVVVPNTGTKVFTQPIDFRDQVKPHVIPPTVTPPPRPAASNTLAHNTPVISHDMPIESIPTNNQLNNSPVGPTTNPNPGPDGPLVPSTGPAIIPKEEDKNKVFLIVEQMPKFPGGSVLDYLKNKTNYPQELIQAGIMGTVYYTFVIEADGSVSNVEIQKGVAGGPQLADEVIAAIKAMPAWTPGSQNGHEVRVRYSGRISFSLQQ